MILIVAAMQEEIKDIAKSILPDTHVIVTGVGKVNAAMRLTETLQKERVEAIINVGFVGATNAYNVGELVLIKQAKYHDFNLSMFGYEKGQVPGYPECFESDFNLVMNLKKRLPNIKEGFLLTGDYFMTEEVNGCYVFDMEGAALYQVAHHYQIPLLSVKVVSDIVGMENHIDQYRKFEAEQGSQTLKEVYTTLFGG